MKDKLAEIKDKAKSIWEEHYAAIVTAGSLVGVYVLGVALGAKANDISIARGIAVANGCGIIKFHNPRTGDEIAMSEATEMIRTWIK